MPFSLQHLNSLFKYLHFSLLLVLFFYQLLCFVQVWLYLLVMLLFQVHQVQYLVLQLMILLVSSLFVGVYLE